MQKLKSLYHDHQLGENRTRTFFNDTRHILTISICLWNVIELGTTFQIDHTWMEPHENELKQHWTICGKLSKFTMNSDQGCYSINANPIITHYVVPTIMGNSAKRHWYTFYNWYRPANIHMGQFHNLDWNSFPDISANNYRTWTDEGSC